MSAATHLASAQGIDVRSLGFDPRRLGTLDAYLQRQVDGGLLAGCQIALARRGKIAHVATFGRRSLATADPADLDTIWRIYSMTKPITAVAALMLWEEGAFELTDPLSRFLPEFENMSVWCGGSADAPDLEPAGEPIRLWHLMTHSAGLSYAFQQFHPVNELYRRSGLLWADLQSSSLAEACARIAGMPLIFQPGTHWSYSMGLEVLGRVVEVLSGQTLGDFMRERIFQPLGMADTHFALPEGETHRLATLYGRDPATGALSEMEEMGRQVLSPPAAHFGGAGLVSTLPDYLRFARMLCDGGIYEGSRILSPRTIAMATHNHLPGGADLRAIGMEVPGEAGLDGVGFGLLGSVVTDPVAARSAASVGDYGWGGAASTYFWVDPVEQMTCVFMTQSLGDAFGGRGVLKQFVKQALVD
jgi:CubicO group peptidase (beta-lactamase class C family)